MIIQWMENSIAVNIDGCLCLPLTFDVDVLVKESDGFYLEKCSKVLEADLEWVAIIKLKMHVYVES